MKLLRVFNMALALAASGANAEHVPSKLQDLGKALFFDTALSLNSTQSCATCHDPEHAFIDPRSTAAGRAVSLGDDGVSLGDRNTPTIAYAGFTPAFHRNDRGQFIGGLFLDGRAAALEDQAGGPPLNPIEMGMPDQASIVTRLRENPAYVHEFSTVFGADIWQDEPAAFEAMTQAIASYLRTDEFAPFDSRYDRFLNGDETLNAQEERGRALFFDPQRSNCSRCHVLRDQPDHPQETFTNYRYHNIGVPVNTVVRAANGLGERFVDQGLLLNPHVDHPAQEGRFRVPTLRNVAVTEPYMHNGVFDDLRTVVLFYLKYTSFDAKRQKNPNTGETWHLPEVKNTLAVSDLIKGQNLSEREIDALVAFLKTLTDARYEHLMEE